MKDYCVSRRAFAAVGVLGFAASARAAAAERVPIVDTHLHCFAGSADARFGYHADAPYRPTESATPEHLLKTMAAAGVDYAIVVHPEPYQDDHRYLEHCLKVGAGKLKGTALFFAGRPNLEARLRVLAKAVPLVAVRVHAYAPERLPPFGSPELKALWGLAGDLNLAVQLHFEPRYAARFEPYFQAFPKVRVLVDHLGRPMQGTVQEYASVLGWAKYEQVVVKLSSVPEKGKYPHRDPVAIVKQLTTAFGADRLMYGGGYAHDASGATYRAERERVGAMLSHLTVDDRAKIFGGTAARVFGFRV